MAVLLALDSSTDSLAIALTGPGGSTTSLFEGSGGPKASEQVVPDAPGNSVLVVQAWMATLGRQAPSVTLE